MKSDAKNLTGIHFGVIIHDALGKTLRNAGVPDEKIPDCNRDFWNHVREGFVSIGQPAENILLQQADGKAGVLVKYAETGEPQRGEQLGNDTDVRVSGSGTLRHRLGDNFRSPRGDIPE